jgi:hypothetical protein
MESVVINMCKIIEEDGYCINNPTTT